VNTDSDIFVCLLDMLVCYAAFSLHCITWNAISVLLLLILLLLLVLLQAVCCSDHEHCCPSGTTCDVAAGTCTQESHSMSWYEVALRNENRLTSNDVVCPGGQATCPDGSTCCQLASGDYGCCPLPKVLPLA